MGSLNECLVGRAQEAWDECGFMFSERIPDEKISEDARGKDTTVSLAAAMHARQVEWLLRNEMAMLEAS